MHHAAAITKATRAYQSTGQERSLPGRDKKILPDIELLSPPIGK
jgi:hypothetical protein